MASRFEATGSVFGSSPPISLEREIHPTTIRIW